MCIKGRIYMSGENSKKGRTMIIFLRYIRYSVSCSVDVCYSQSLKVFAGILVWRENRNCLIFRNEYFTLLKYTYSLQSNIFISKIKRRSFLIYRGMRLRFRSLLEYHREEPLGIAVLFLIYFHQRKLHLFCKQLYQKTFYAF